MLIAGAGTIPLADVVHSCPQLKHVIWVVQPSNRHIDWNEVPEGFGGKVGVSVWHEMIEEKRSSIGGDLPYDVDRPEDSFRLVTIWQREGDEVGDVVEYTQAVSIPHKRKTCPGVPNETRTSSLEYPRSSHRYRQSGASPRRIYWYQLTR